MRTKTLTIAGALVAALALTASCSSSGNSGSDSSGSSTPAATSAGSTGTAGSSGTAPSSGGGSAPTTGSGSEITVGTIFSLTGTGALIGKSQQVAFQLGLDDAEKDTGVKVNIVGADAGDSNTVALSALKSVLRANPSVIFGPYLGTQILAMRPDLHKAQVPMMVESGTKSIVEGADADMVYRWYLSTAISEPATAKYTVDKLGVKKAAILYDTTSYGQDGLALVEAQLASQGVDVVDKEALDPKAKDYSGQVHTALSKNPDAIYVQLIGGASGGVLLKNLSAAGNKAHIVWGSGIVSQSLLGLVTADEVNGAYGNSVAIVDSSNDNPKIQDFLKRFKEKAGFDGDQFALAAYDAAQFIVRGAAAGIQTPQQWADHLNTTKYAGLLANYANAGSHNMVTQTTIVLFQGKTPTVAAVDKGANG
jgi:branched-chain amino acid transport system substrate-binding protein